MDNVVIKNPLSKNGKTILFTCQDERSLDVLSTDGRFINKREYIKEHLEDVSIHMLNLYDWFVLQAEKRVPKPSDVNYQIWCSVHAKSCIKAEKGEVTYILEVPDENILYFNGMKWDYVLNHHYVPKDSDDAQEYEKDIKQKGFKNSYSFLDESYKRMYPEEAKRIMESWVRVFDIHTWNIFELQANLWEIKKEWVKEVLHYGDAMPEKYFLM